MLFRSPGNGILAIERAGNLQAQVFREGRCGNRTNYLNVYVGDTITRNRLTVDLGVRVDRQDGEALASNTKANPAFPNVVPGVVFAGYNAVHLEQRVAACRRDVCPRRREQDRGAGQIQPLCRSAQHRYRRRTESEFDGRVGHLSLDGQIGRAHV